MPNSIGPSPEFLPRTEARVPAWILSVALHTLLLITIALVARPPSPQGRSESERTVRIALAHVTRPRMEYLLEDTAAEEDRGAVAEDATSPTPDDSALPDELGDKASDGLTDGPRDAQPSSQVAAEFALPEAAPGARPYLPGSRPLTETAGQPSRRLPRQTDYSAWVKQEAARLRALKPSGPTASVSLFGGATSSGRSFVFLLDRSKSMGSGGLNALAAAERELKAALSTLQPEHRFAVLAYHHDVVYLGEPRLLPATLDHKQRLPEFFAGLAAYGQTEHAYGIEAALVLSPDVVYVFSDAGEPPPTPNAQRRIIREAQRQGTTLHTVRFGYGPLRDEGGFLRTFADATGGGFTYVNMAP